MPIFVRVPKYCVNEHVYTIKVLLGELLGIEYVIGYHNQDNVEFSLDNSPSKLVIKSFFFKTANKYWFDKKSMPTLPLSEWDPRLLEIKVDLVEDTLPILFGNEYYLDNSEGLTLGLDIIGTIFFMLSRYEEGVLDNRDIHDRFMAKDSIASKGGFLERPLVDEYTEILWACFLKLWPSIKRAEEKSMNFVTCDVDWPIDPALHSVKRMVYKFGNALLKKKDIFYASKILIKYCASKLGLNVRDDNFENIKWIMDANEKEGNKVAFYFITFNTSTLDSNVDLSSPLLSSLFKEINNRGHEIGLHPGYNCYDNPENFNDSVKNLQCIFSLLGIEQTKIGGRMHYLRWNYATTPALWERNGLDYDSTLMYAEVSGFRCGTSKEFTMYDLVNRVTFSLKQRPLISMECTVISSDCENLQYSEMAMKRFQEFKKKTQKYNGIYTLLWHNSHLETNADKEFYEEIIK